MTTLQTFIAMIALYSLFSLLQLCHATKVIETFERDLNLALGPERGFIEPMLDDICLWADGTWCYRHELSGMNFMSDDITILTVGSESYDIFLDRV